jgi:hypothetical protein
MGHCSFRHRRSPLEFILKRRHLEKRIERAKTYKGVPVDIPDGLPLNFALNAEMINGLHPAYKKGPPPFSGRGPFSPFPFSLT